MNESYSIHNALRPYLSSGNDIIVWDAKFCANFPFCVLCMRTCIEHSTFLRKNTMTSIMRMKMFRVSWYDNNKKLQQQRKTSKCIFNLFPIIHHWTACDGLTALGTGRHRFFPRRSLQRDATSSFWHKMWHSLKLVLLESLFVCMQFHVYLLWCFFQMCVCVCSLRMYDAVVQLKILPLQNFDFMNEWMDVEWKKTKTSLFYV